MFHRHVLVPVMVGLSAGGRAWLPYGMLAAIVGFSGDTGGQPWPRLAWMAAAVGALAIGGAIGTWVQGSPLLLCLAFALAGILYALTESAHAIALTMSRFGCFALALSALQAPLGLFDLKILAGVTLLAWLISIAWDLAAGAWRPSTVPHWRAVMLALHARELKRVTFAVATAITIPLAFLASSALGLQKPYWTMLTLVLVLRVDFLSSRRQMLDRFAGTLLGVMAAGLLAYVAPSHHAMMPALILVALLRWPAQQQHGILGVASMTAFVMLTIEITAISSGDALPLLEARILDTALGCVFALVALLLEHLLRRTVLRIRLTRRAPLI
ncbi:FUSC family protein [Phreatobacter stygius]|uniref:FUSC family protein n=1 Tax=Phreatobacter stygius TaxID=1940610 RepID=UPI0014776C6C|nr:FUSC family protein [Phreatobacter stygius]